MWVLILWNNIQGEKATFPKVPYSWWNNFPNYWSWANWWWYSHSNRYLLKSSMHMNSEVYEVHYSSPTHTFEKGKGLVSNVLTEAHYYFCQLSKSLTDILCKIIKYTYYPWIDFWKSDIDTWRRCCAVSIIQKLFLPLFDVL